MVPLLGFDIEHVGKFFHFFLRCLGSHAGLSHLRTVEKAPLNCLFCFFSRKWGMSEQSTQVHGVGGLNNPGFSSGRRPWLILRNWEKSTVTHHKNGKRKRLKQLNIWPLQEMLKFLKTGGRDSGRKEQAGALKNRRETLQIKTTIGYNRVSAPVIVAQNSRYKIPPKCPRALKMKALKGGEAALDFSPLCHGVFAWGTLHQRRILTLWLAKGSHAAGSAKKKWSRNILPPVLKSFFKAPKSSSLTEFFWKTEAFFDCR